MNLSSLGMRQGNYVVCNSLGLAALQAEDLLIISCMTLDEFEMSQKCNFCICKMVIIIPP
jgi:hypothetical protein